MKKKYLILSGLAFCLLPLNAQQLKKGYIDEGKQLSENFSKTLNTWSKGQQVTEDDNFYISRVKPKARFRNAATQVNQSLDATNDKKLIYWVPINSTPFNALPDGVFDSEVFPMWSYITHYGNWTAPFVRMPGNFADVAHKNGVGVSVVAGVPFGSLSSAWRDELGNLVTAGSEKMGDFMEYYGVDGLGYNSEFSTGNTTLLANLRTYHEDLTRRFKTSGLNPVFENIWYDGTSDTGGITFDQGLGTHNDDTFGDKDHPRTSLFFNYNWNKSWLIDGSITKAIEMGRDPLDLYCGFNMQGAEPKSGTRWPLLVGKNLSIGLWGAHSENMPWESRGEKGALPSVQQRTYMLRVERWFTGGSRNPVNTPEVTSSMSYNADNVNFHGMSKFMTARSSLKWSLSDEPFITYFNLGNGKFFNWEGKRQIDREWYNIGIQDYLPTWRWWFADKFLGRTPADVPASGLDAEFIWDDAWMGGSLMRIYGASSEEYLHMFKTEFNLQSGDEITVRYKVMSGSTDLTLALSAKGNENTILAENGLKVIEKSTVETEKWIEKKFVVRGALAALNGKDLAVVALHFRNAENLNLYLGEFSIIRGTTTSTKPAIPVIKKTVALGANFKGVDGKIIFDMPNNKGNNVCYNLDVKTSLFKLYAQQKGKEQILMGATTSWAGMYFAVPVDFTVENPQVRFGVSALSLDMKSESDIAWGDYQDPGEYSLNDDITINKTTIKPGEDFVISYVDGKHESGLWKILNDKGEVVLTHEGIVFSVPEGLTGLGNYAVELQGKVMRASSGERIDSLRRWGGYVQITDEKTGALPKILALTANDKDKELKVKAGDPVTLKYTGRKADGSGSRGMNMQEVAFGFKSGDFKMQAFKPFTVAFWVKVNQYLGDTQLLSIRDKTEAWPKTDWGWVWNFLNKDGRIEGVTFRGSDASGNNELKYYYDTKIETGPWTHIAYVFDFNNSNQVMFTLYVNGVKQMPTQWSRTKPNGHDRPTKGEPTWQGDLYPMNPGNKIAIGGPQHSAAGIDGTIDNYQYWNKALSAEEVKYSMGDIDTKNLPADLYGFWSVETEANADGTLNNEGTYKENAAPAGRHDYAAGAAQGQGNFQWREASYYPGCPFISGTAYPVVTTPKWLIDKAEISGASGSDLQGQATAKFSKDGIYTATLTLENGWGKDSKTFNYIEVGDGVGIESNNLEAEFSTYPNPFVDYVNVRFASEGEYTIRIYDLSGVLYGEKVQHVNAGEFMQIGVNGGTGSYVAQILKDGKLVRAVKLLKK